jgi:hypothetical protein
MYYYLTTTTTTTIGYILTMIYDDLSMSQVEITRYNKALFTETRH